MKQAALIVWILCAAFFVSTKSYAEDDIYKGSLTFVINDLPAFSEYPVPESHKFNGKAAKSVKDIKQYFTMAESHEATRVRFEKAIEEGPNYSGKYHILSLKGCGTGCATHAILDLETGAVVETFMVRTGGNWHVDSNLLIVDMRAPDMEAGIWYTPPVVQFYIMVDGKLKLIESVTEPLVKSVNGTDK